MILLYECFYTFYQKVKDDNGKETDVRELTMEVVYDVRVYYLKGSNIINLQIRDLNCDQLYSNYSTYVDKGFKERIVERFDAFIESHRSFISLYSSTLYAHLWVVEEDEKYVVVRYECLDEPITKVNYQVVDGEKVSIYGRKI